MADNTQLNQNTTPGDIIATDEISGVKHQYVKLEYGVDGVATKVSVADPLPTTIIGAISIDTTGLATEAKQDTEITAIGTGNTSLASIKTNTDKIPTLGQALAAASTPVVLPATQITALTPPAAITGFLTEADFDTKAGSLTETAPASDTASSGLNGRLQRIAQRITSLIALIPASLGQKTKAASLAVTLASDSDTLPVSLATAPALVAGTAVIGKVGIDQTTPGTTNLVALTAETTKVIGTVNVAAAQTLANVTTVGTITNNVNTVEVVPATVLNGKTSVTTAGTRVVLAASTSCKSVTIKALSTNTGFIYVGNSSVSSSNGFQLQAGESVSLDIANLNTVNIDSSVNGESVSYIAIAT